MRILVTGGAGFIGSHLVEHFQGKAEVRVLDSLRSGYRKNLDGFEVEFIEGDIRDRQMVDKAMKDVDYVFHLAAMISVPESMTKITECIEINNTGMINVLEAAAANGVKKLCFSTSAAIYGDNPVVPKVETMFPEPKSPYAEFFNRNIQFTGIGKQGGFCTGIKEKSPAVIFQQQRQPEFGLQFRVGLFIH